MLLVRPCGLRGRGWVVGGALGVEAAHHGERVGGGAHVVDPHAPGAAPAEQRDEGGVGGLALVDGAGLAVGAGEDKAVVENGAVVVRKRMRVTMSCDHRIIDGATGAKFLQTLRRLVENPLMLL